MGTRTCVCVSKKERKNFFRQLSTRTDVFIKLFLILYCNFKAKIDRLTYCVLRISMFGRDNRFWNLTIFLESNSVTIKRLAFEYTGGRIEK